MVLKSDSKSQFYQIFLNKTGIASNFWTTPQLQGNYKKKETPGNLLIKNGDHFVIPRKF